MNAFVAIDLEESVTVTGGNRTAASGPGSRRSDADRNRAVKPLVGIDVGGTASTHGTTSGHAR